MNDQLAILRKACHRVGPRGRHMDQQGEIYRTNSAVVAAAYVECRRGAITVVIAFPPPADAIS